MGSGRTERSSKRRPLITKRVCVRLTLLLIAGAIVNVAVAWGCVLRNGGYSQRSLDLSERVRRLERIGYHTEQHWPGTEMSGFGTRTLTLVGVAEGPEVRGITLHVLEAGWPILSVSEEWHSVQLGRNPANQTLYGGWALWKEDFPQRIALPFRPLWPNFAINTLFYAAILWLLFASLFALRRRRRVKRGLCVKCAYDLRGRAPTSDACPECGAVVIGAFAASIKDI